MTDNEFNKLPDEVKKIIDDANIDIEKIKVRKDGHGVSITMDIETKNAFDDMMGMSGKNPVNDFMEFLGDIIDDDTDDDEACPFEEFTDYCKSNAIKAKFVSDIVQNTDDIMDTTLSKVCDMPMRYIKLMRMFAKSDGTDEKAFIVPITGLIKVHAENEEEAVDILHKAIDKGYMMPLHHDCLPCDDYELDVFDASAIDDDGPTIDDELDDCPFSEMCRSNR